MQGVFYFNYAAIMVILLYSNLQESFDTLV